MSSTNASSLIAGAIGLVLGICGGAAGALLIPRDRPVPLVEPDSPSIRGLEAAVESLAAEVRSLRDAREAPSLDRLPADAAREPATERLWERLEQAITRLAEVLAASPPPASQHAPGTRMGGSSIPAKREDRLAALRSDPVGARSRPYRFWSLDQVLDHFGAPDSVTIGGGNILNLVYATEDGGTVILNLHDGRLYDLRSSD